MIDLLKRLTAAEIGGWGLDAEIAAAIGCTKAPQSNPYNSLRLLHPNGRTIDLPAYTTSVDAALSLVLEGWHVEVTGEQGAEGWGVRLTADDLLDVIGLAPDLALAICIAAIYARKKEH